jgi:hypothetical protein
LPLHEWTGQVPRQRVAAGFSYPAKLRIIRHQEGEELGELKCGTESDAVSAERAL